MALAHDLQRLLTALDLGPRYFSRIVADPRLPVGHNPAQEAPEDLAATIELLRF